MGEIGRDRTEFLYHMTYSEIVLIIRGYRHRNILQYQLQRMQIHASAFCMGNPDHVKPTDIVHLYFDDYTNQEVLPVTEEYAQAMVSEMNMLTQQLFRKDE